MSPPGRIPSLDGMRAASIVLVILGHNRLWHPWGTAPQLEPLVGLVSNGDLGVSVFFVISGFLITTLLVREVEATGTVGLRNFYLRRAFRIIPAYYVFLLTLMALSWGRVIAVPAGTMWSSVLFLRNYLTPVEHSTDWYTAHCWSLSVEEQFYLFWPVCLAALGRRRAVWLSSGLIAVAPLSRITTYALWPDMRREINYLLHTRVDTLMWGCLVALLFDSVAFSALRVKLYRLRVPLIAALFVSIASPWLRQRFQGAYLFTVGYGAEGACITAVMLWAVECSGGIIGRLLNCRPIVHLGTVSYSAYLWQQLFTSFPLPLFIAATLAAAEVSYWLVEKPFLALRIRFAAGDRRGAATGLMNPGEGRASDQSSEGGSRELINDRADA